MATVNENLNRIKTAKASIKASIEAKGVTVPADALIDTYAAKIDEIQTGGATGPIRMADHPELRLGGSTFSTFTNDDFDFTGVTNMRFMFSNCSSLTALPDGFSCPNATDMTSMFESCSSLTTLPDGFNCPDVVNISQLFTYCFLLTAIPKLDFGRVELLNYVFGWIDISSLTDLGGFTGLKVDWTDDGGLARLPNLTKQSVLNVINELYDFRANGDESTTRTIKFHPNSLALLTDEEKAIATNKGWVLA